jgi:hypothetical protein
MKAVNSMPATVAAVLGAAASLVIAFGHLTPAQSAMVMSLAGAIGTLAVVIAGSIAGKPVSLQLVTGAVTVLAADLALFGIHTNPEQRAALAAAVGVFAGVVLHLLHVTVAAVPSRQADVTADPAAAPHRPSGTGNL